MSLKKRVSAMLPDAPPDRETLERIYLIALVLEEHGSRSMDRRSARRILDLLEGRK